MAKLIVEIATHEKPNVRPVANEGATQRGVARANTLTKRRRVAIAKKGAEARWGKGRKG